MEMHPRLFTILIVTAILMALIGAAGVLGRGIDAKFVVVEIREEEPNAVTYGILDLDREILARRVIAVPGYSSTSFGQFPPLVMQSVWGDGTIDWTLNSVDVWTGELTPEMKIQTDRSTYLEAFFFRQYADGHWLYQNPSAANMYFTHGEELEAEAIEVPAPTIILSNDGMRFAIDVAGMLSFADLETSEMKAVMHGVRSPADIRWSPDDRYITVFKSGNIDSTMQVIDTESLEIVAEFPGRALRWCGDRLIYITNPREAIFEAWLHDWKPARKSFY